MTDTEATALLAAGGGLAGGAVTALKKRRRLHWHWKRLCHGKKAAVHVQAMFPRASAAKLEYEARRLVHRGMK